MENFKISSALDKAVNGKKNNQMESFIAWDI